MSDLAIFAGRGALPEELQARNSDAYVVSFEGTGLDFSPQNLIETPFERSGGLLEKLKKQGVKRICFAGKISRPDLKLSKLDAKTLSLLPKIKKAIANSDGDALRIIRELVEGEGFEVVGAHEIAPDLVVELGSLGSLKAPELNLARVKQIHLSMSNADIGQAIVMRDKQCLAVETLPGTKAMLEFVAQQKGEGGYLYKTSKSGQDLAMDMASIGPETIEQVKAARLDGVVLGAGRTLILEKETTVSMANQSNLFLLGV